MSEMEDGSIASRGGYDGQKMNGDARGRAIFGEWFLARAPAEFNHNNIIMNLQQRGVHKKTTYVFCCLSV